MKNSKIIVLFVLLLFFSCKKDELGGKSVIKGAVIHHEKNIPFATVFIKFGAKEFPGSDTALYDSKVRADAEGNYNIKCYKGDYFLYAYGFDNTIVPPRVIGGRAIHIRNNETVEVEIPVTEG